jgi:hypothetical protein
MDDLIVITYPVGENGGLLLTLSSYQNVFSHGSTQGEWISASRAGSLSWSPQMRQVAKVEPCP